MTNLKEIIRIAKREGIARRYLVINSFDGVLTILGILIAFYIVGLNVRLVIIGSLGASIAMMISGFSGAFLAEKAERKREMKGIEKHLLRKIDKTVISRNVKTVILVVALINGISPFLVSVILVSPFFFSAAGLLLPETAFYISIAIIISTLFSIGAVLGKISKESLLMNGLKMVAAGIGVVLASLLLEFLKFT